MFKWQERTNRKLKLITLYHFSRCVLKGAFLRTKNENSANALRCCFLAGSYSHLLSSLLRANLSHSQTCSELLWVTALKLTKWLRATFEGTRWLFCIFDGFHSFVHSFVRACMRPSHPSSSKRFPPSSRFHPETHSAIASRATILFSPHFDVICDRLLNRHNMESICFI